MGRNVLTCLNLDAEGWLGWQGGILFFLRGSGVTFVENFARNSVIFDIYSIDSSVVHLAQ